MRRLLVVLMILAAGVAVPIPDASAAPAISAGLPTCTPGAAIDRMVGYIRTQQRPDGSFPSIGQSSTADAVYALVASGVNPSRVRTGGNSAIDWIYTQTGSLDSTGTAAKFLLALILARRSTVAPNGFDYLARVRNAFDPATGLYDANPTGNHYALIALRAAGQRVPAAAIQALLAQQQADGGWSAYLPPQNTDTNTTAVAIIALILNGRSGAPVTRALGYLRTQLAPEGGFTFSTVFGNASDANSTGLVIPALLAAGQNLRRWEVGGIDPVERLLQLQEPSGAFRFSDAFPGDNAFATFQAGPAAGLTRC
ncbi:MAG TPA: prenyltransferase/squalene oxidase repeat-containing protein [Actinophytocola sp.]|uniref:prenyltransferase/squalene oxidase repeat-containing protein n=1 Tax=Actinophytocola sp. TaxID=1872138 RepID=UPI002E0AD9D4|nr:prenyltransferase/squalene oxidase repeat-containing protein [Actinophytocola sp.]